MKRKNADKISFWKLRSNVLISLVLVVSILAVYWQVRNYDFVSFDDDIYVSNNPHVQAGLTLEGIKWAFDINYADYYLPLAWLSHMLDCQLYGMDPGMHHTTNVIFHIANSLLLFFILKRMTGALWQSAFVAALFAVHPVNVESVAWVAERKNVLSTFLLMLTLVAYNYYTKRPDLYRYLLTFLIFGIGLLAKPALATLPFVLLLLDFWPLGRIRCGQVDRAGDENQEIFLYSGCKISGFLYPVLEKIPLLVLSFVSVYLSALSYEHKGIIISLESVSMKLRIANALVSYVNYIVKMFWPQNLAVLYPYPSMLPVWKTVGAGLLLIGISAIVFLLIRRTPYVFVGWFWFLGTLFPVIGLKQAGLWPAMADRWAYVPYIGLFIIIAWGGSELLAKRRYGKICLITAPGVFIVILMLITSFQVRYWANSTALFKHSLEVSGSHLVIHNNLANALAREGRIDEAFTHYNEVLRISPTAAETYNNMGAALMLKGKNNEAAVLFRKALEINPDYPDARKNLARALEAVE